MRLSNNSLQLPSCLLCRWSMLLSYMGLRRMYNRACVWFIKVEYVWAKNKKDEVKKKRKTINQTPPLALLPRWYRDSINEPRSLFPWKHLWMRKGPGNPGDSVNEKLPPRPNGRCFSETEISSLSSSSSSTSLYFFMSIIKIVTGLSHITDKFTSQSNSKSL